MLRPSGVIATQRFSGSGDSSGLREQPAAATQPTRVEVEVPGDLTVWADPARMRQLLTNVLDNATRHAPEGTSVRLMAGGEPTGSWWLEVHDEGPGVEPEERTRTQPFSTWHTLARRDLTERDMWGMSPIDQMVCRIQFRRAAYEGIYTPPTADRRWIQYPGYNGGSDWGGVAVDTERGIMVANYNNTANRNRLVEREIMGEITDEGTTLYELKIGLVGLWAAQNKSLSKLYESKNGVDGPEPVRAGMERA